MATWIGAWLGPIGDGGTGTRLPALTGIKFGVPVQTRLIEVLQEELNAVEGSSGVEVWPDVDASTGIVDSIVVIPTGGESLTQTNSWQQMHREFEIIVSCTTSDRAERLLDDVMMIIKRRRDAFSFTTANVMRGTYDPESETFQRGVIARFRGRR